MAVDGEVEEEVQKLRKELKKIKKEKKEMTKKLEESEKHKEEIKNLKKEKKELKKKIGGQWEEEGRFGGAASNKNGSAPEQLESIYRADGAGM